jgi:hypothetical protein
LAWLKSYTATTSTIDRRMRMTLAQAQAILTERFGEPLHVKLQEQVVREFVNEAAKKPVPKKD